MNQAFLDIDELGLEAALVDQARSGSNKAKERLRRVVTDIVLAHGPREVHDDLTVVSLRELRQLGIIKKVKIIA